MCIRDSLALAACLRAGLDGIEKKMKLPECVQGNMFTMDPEDLERRGVERIPETLGDAIEAFEKDAFIREVLGEHIFHKYLEAKMCIRDSPHTLSPSAAPQSPGAGP